MDARLNIDTYVEEHSDAEPELLHQLDRQTHLRFITGRMVSGHLQGRILKMLIRMINPSTILELGTFTGYSALSMAEGLLKEDAQIHTIEIDDELEPIQTEFLSQTPLSRFIHVHFGKAEEIVPELQKSMQWDVVFMDANKRHYIEYYNMVFPYVKQGGYIIADNVLWDGKVIGEIPKKDAAQTIGIREFNDMVAADTRVEKVILPIRDGLTLIRKL